MHAAILSFGRYVPHARIEAKTIAEHWKRGTEQADGLGITEKSVAAADEDAFTLAWEASRQALETGDIDPNDIEAIFVGSESHPYAVKPTSAMLVTALKLNPFCRAADLEFACKAGTAAIQIIAAMAESRQITYGLAIASDTAQSKPGDALEYSAAAGAAAFIVGLPTKSRPGLPAVALPAGRSLGEGWAKAGICSIDATLSYTSDTPDFWRGTGDRYPSHAGRFTGEPAYFHHLETATRKILEETGLQPMDIDHVVFHMPNAKFPLQAAKRLGFTDTQMQAGFIVRTIGNAYAACSPLGLVEVLQVAKKDQRMLLVSYGSGAGSDAFVFTMLRDGVPLPPDQAQKDLKRVSYAEYLQASKIVA